MTWLTLLVPIVVALIMSIPSYLSLRTTRRVHKTVRDLANGKYAEITTRMDTLDATLNRRILEVEKEMSTLYDAIVTYMPQRRMRWRRWSK